MENNNEINETINNEMIVLLNGNKIKGYGREDVAETLSWNGLTLDTSGEYLRIGNQRPNVKKDEKPKETSKFFLDHAFFFLANADKILADSRMFLARVPVQNGLAYTGTSGFCAPTLGVYIEWWLNCPSSILEEGGKKYLAWHIAGSPLSGSNRCGIVDEKGKSQTHFFLRFSKLWHSFVEINTRYTDAKNKFYAYTIEEVYQLLSKNDKEK